MSRFDELSTSDKRVFLFNNVMEKEMTNEQKQVLISGILGDGCYISDKKYMQYSCIHEEYMYFKSNLLHNWCLSPTKKINKGYKKSPIFTLRTLSKNTIKEFMEKNLDEMLREIDELGLALWFLDDGSRHKDKNFYNINTHSFSRYIEESLLIPTLNKFNIFPSVLTENKKDGRKFSYLYVSKWQGAMEISRIIRKLGLKCYAYKLIPKEIEDAYFKIKDTKEWNKLNTSLKKTLYIKKLLNIENKESLGDKFKSEKYINSTELFS